MRCGHMSGIYHLLTRLISTLVSRCYFVLSTAKCLLPNEAWQSYVGFAHITTLEVFEISGISSWEHIADDGIDLGGRHRFCLSHVGKN